LFLLIER